MNTQTYQIFDRIIKCILLSSAKAVILFINALFNVNHSINSRITYNLTEQLDDDLSKRIADNIITLNTIFSYHLEAQITKDNTIVFRVFDYDYHHAVSHKGNSHILKFPKSSVLYLGDNKTVPDEETLTLEFEDGNSCTFHIKIFKILDYTLEELDQMNLVLLTPFLLLRFRKKIKKSRSQENISELQTFILHDIINILKKNVDTGLLTELDAIRLYQMTCKLYNHLYSHYEEFQVEGGLNDMIENEFFLEADRMQHEFNLKSQEAERLKQEKETLERKSVQSIFQLTKDPIQTATSLGLSIPQVKKHLNDLKIPYQAV